MDIEDLLVIMESKYSPSKRFHDELSTAARTIPFETAKDDLPRDHIAFIERVYEVDLEQRDSIARLESLAYDVASASSMTDRRKYAERLQDGGIPVLETVQEQVAQILVHGQKHRELEGVVIAALRESNEHMNRVVSTLLNTSRIVDEPIRPTDKKYLN